MDAKHARGFSAIGAVFAEIALVALVVAGCAVAQQGGTEVTPTIPDPPPPPTTSAVPTPEPKPDPRVSIELAQLPIGGNATRQDDETFADRCVEVNWIVDEDAAEIPAGVQIRITGATFTDDVYRLADSGCDGENWPCIGFVFDADDQICELAIEPTGTPPGSPDTNLFVSVSGLATCEDGGSEECISFLLAVEREEGVSIPLNTPSLDEPS